MTRREKECPRCNLIYSYDDGVDERTHSLGLMKYGYCPRCDDPHYIAELSVKKEDIFQLFSKYLNANGISVASLDLETILSMLKEFPRCFSLYNSNSTYHTINVLPGTTFAGLNGNFELGATVRKDRSNGIFTIGREVKCLRCNRVVYLGYSEWLECYLGIRGKRCKNCDNWKRNTNGLWKGYQGNEFQTNTYLACALNVSRMDFARHRPTKPVPSLPVGTVVGHFKILAAYWDNNPNSYSPKYLVKCEKCGVESRPLQKSINNLTHYCSAVGRMV